MNQTAKLSEVCHFTERQLQATKTADEFGYTLYGGAAGGGKALEVNTPIPTPFGWTTMGEIRGGDFVLSEKGTCCLVLQAHPVENNTETYRIVFDEGSEIVSSANHLWLTFSANELDALTRRSERHRKMRKLKRKSLASGNKSTLFTEAIVKRNQERQYSLLSDPKGTIRTTKQINESIKTSHGRSNHAISLSYPLELLSKDLPLDPYVLGVWLGDGTSSSGGLTCADQEIIEEIRKHGFRVKKWTAKYTWGIEGLKQIIRKMDLLNKKHIPLVYLRGSKDQRMALLQGLMDTDGTVSENGCAQFTNTNLQIVNGVYELIVSLGWKARIIEGRARLYGKDCGAKYTITWTPSEYVFRLPRKKSKQRIASRRTTKFRYIVSCERVPSIPVRCITVDNPTGLFLAGRSMIPTHNSYWLRWYPLRWLIKKNQETGIKGLRFGLFCEDYPALKDRHISKMQFEFPSWLGELKDDSKQGLGFVLRPDFGSGTLALRNLDDPSKYFSSEFAGVAIDELTKNSKETFDFIRMRKRHPGIAKTCFIAGTNPGSVGHEWVKKIWIDGEFDDNEQEKEQFKFVPAKVEDNPYLDISYIKSLDSLPEKLRKAYRDGNWNTFEGQFFAEWDSNKHTMDPFPIPSSWKRFRSIDISGRSGITSCHWFALDWDGNVYVYREHYRTGLDADEHAREIARLSEGEVYQYTVIDSSAFDKIGFPESIAEVYMRNGINGFVASSKNRIAGWDFMHQFLRWTNEQPPKLKFFTNCKNAIRTIPNLIHDELHPEDLNTRGEDHSADDVRYFLQTLRDAKTPEGELPKTMNHIQRRLEEIKKNKGFSFY